MNPSPTPEEVKRRVDVLFEQYYEKVISDDELTAGINAIRAECGLGPLPPPIAEGNR